MSSLATRAPVADVPVSKAEFAQARYLIELVASDLNWSCLQVATLALALDAAARDPLRHPLRPWRHLLIDDGKAITLALRYSGQLGLETGAAETLEAFCVRLASEKRLLKKSLGERDGDLESKPALLAAASRTWRELAAVARATLARARPIIASLAAEYGQDARAIDAFLADAAAGGGSRLDARGGFAIPKLTQRRRSPRASVDIACRLAIGSETVEARIVDVSREGLGLVCARPAPIGTLLQVLVADRRKLGGRVVRSGEGRLGLSLAKPLASSDPLFRPT